MNSHFVAFSDIQFYKNQAKSRIVKSSLGSWFENQVDIIKQVFNWAELRGIDVVIHNGDLFEEKNRIPQDLYNAVWDIFKFYSKDFNIIFNTGNHDILTFSGKSSLKPFSDIVTVVDKPRDFEFGNDLIRIIPYGQVSQNLGVPCGYDKCILFTHEDISGLKYGSTNMEVSNQLKYQIFSDWDIVFNGHIHKPQELNNIINIGSPMIQDWGEADEVKRFIVYNGNIEFIDTKYPRFFSVESIDGVKEDDDYNYYRVNISPESLSAPIFKKFNVSSNITKRRDRIIRLKEDLDENEEIQEYVNLQNTGLDKGKLTKLGREIIKSGQD